MVPVFALKLESVCQGTEFHMRPTVLWRLKLAEGLMPGLGLLERAMRRPPAKCEV